MIDDETHRRELGAAFKAGAIWMETLRTREGWARPWAGTVEAELDAEAVRYASYVQWLRKERPPG